MINFEIKILEKKYDDVPFEQQEKMITELNDKIKYDKNFAWTLEDQYEANPSDYIFYTVEIASKDQIWFTHEVWLTRGAMFESLEAQLKKIEQGFEPTFFRQVKNLELRLAQ